ETNNPRSSVPKALLSSTIAIGLLYTFLAYVTVVGFHDNADAIGKAAVPFITATEAAVGGFVFLAYLAGFTSTFGSLIGAVNSQTRILFNSGRERLLPAVLGRVQSQYGTPWVAIVTFLVISTAIVYIFGWAQKPTDFFGIIATAGTIPIAVVYLVTNVALPFFMLRHHRAETQTFRHIVLPILGVLALLLPIWGLVQPGQPYPFNLFPWLTLVVLILALVYGYVAERRDPTLGDRVGSIIADEG
ncbi:MAG: APC family permease, partial [Vulcanimicrobiaceae bacterium]